MTPRRFHWLPFAFLFAGLLTAAGVLYLRHQAEGKSRAVALVLDYPQVRALAAAAGVPLEEALGQFKAAGITGVAVSEETLGELQANGALEIRARSLQSGREYVLTTEDLALDGRIAEYVSHYIGAAPREAMGERVAIGTLQVPGRFDDIRLTPVGLSPEAVARVRGAGLQVVGRLNNPLGLTRDSLRWGLRRVREQGIDTVIFAGEEVLGYRGLIPETAAGLREMGFQYGSVEFGKQRGDDRLAGLVMDRVVRVHSIASAEMPRLTPQEAIERYVRAAAERNIRLNYVRLPGVVTERTFADSLAYVRAVAHGVAEADFGLAAPRPFQPIWGERPLERLPLGVLGMAIAAAAVILLAGLIPLSPGRQMLLTVASAAVGAGLALSGVVLGLQLLALLAAVVFPTLAFVLLPQPVGAFGDHEHAAVRERSQAIVPAVGEFAVISAVTLAGAALIAALLSDLPFFIKVKGFVGIKAATVLPLMLIGWVYLTGMTGLYPDVRTEREAVTERLRTFFSEPIRVWQVLAGLVGLVALALLVARSGNDPGVGVSELELRLRSLLDRFLGVRPRTKEFMIGHPALLLALGMATVPRWRRWALPVMLIGAIGQTGMLNSFCHLHTPIKLTVIRTWNGLWIGGLIGLVLLWGWTRVQRVPEESLRE